MAPYLEQFSNQVVMVVGKVIQLMGETAVMDCGGNITLILSRDSHLRMGETVEIIGKVTSELAIKVMQVSDVGEVDTNAYAAVVDATLRVKDIFYGD